MERLSIVICTHNGKERLAPCLDGILSQSEVDLFELLIVDNASQDGTGDFCKNYLKRYSPGGKWKVIYEPRPGLVNARIAGLREAAYDWVLFCDDDNVLFNDFVEKCLYYLASRPELGVLGSLGIPEFLGEKPDWFERCASSYAVGAQLDSENKGLIHVYGAGSVYRRQPLIDLWNRGFSPIMGGREGNRMSSGDDVEWCWLTQLMGFRVVYNPELRFYHQILAHRLTWKYYLRLKRGISSGAALLFAYRCFYRNPQKSRWGFWISYKIEQTKSQLLYLKYRWKWGVRPQKREDQLAFAILRSRKNSFQNSFRESRNHYQQLQRYFGT